MEGAKDLAVGVKAVIEGGEEKVLQGINRIREHAKNLERGEVSAQNIMQEVVESFDNVHPSTPVGRRYENSTPRIQRNLRKSAIINGRKYSDHAIERMQLRGFIPTVIENTIKNGIISQNKVPGRLSHYDSFNDISVITENGLVVTVSYGRL